MAKYGATLLHYTFSVLILSITLKCIATKDDDRIVHIVYMGSLPENQYSPSSHHLSLLQEVTQSSDVENLLVRSYGRSFNGFAANITKYEAEMLASRSEVVSVFPRTMLEIKTTRSWDFLGLPETAQRNPLVESNVIVGVIDTGIWPESESFSDKGFGPPPKKWKGECKGGKNFTCNKKIIGARYYDLSQSGIESARDYDGHGTHTASTVAGNEVKGASFYGLARGVARGGVPSARIAVYTACDSAGACRDDSVLAAFDDAIADGVDIITVSLGAQKPHPLDTDPIAIGSFHAMEKGIFTSHSAGNEGRGDDSTSSIAPWMLSVAASTTDRQFIDKIALGNGKTLTGPVVNSFPPRMPNSPIIYGNDVADKRCRGHDGCSVMCLNSSVVKGKILVCDDDVDGLLSKTLGAVGYVGVYDTDVPFVVPRPALFLTKDKHDALKTYINCTKNPTATLLKSEAIWNSSAPMVASLSSRGPNFYLPDIMKPDICAPGVDILAAYSPDGQTTGYSEDKRRVKFNILSGTSMACPHAAGVAAYVKTFHPEWSPSAIKSAIMTTALPMNTTINPFGVFSYGSGHINPSKAVDPGLVYDASKADYIQLLCDLGYDAKKIRIISGLNITCPKGSGKPSPWNFNYPSLTTQVARDKGFALQFHRTVTNVGMPNSTYKAKVTTLDSEFRIKVDPQVLSFNTIKEKKSFKVTVSGPPIPTYAQVSASLVWSDGAHVVRSPIAVYSSDYVF